MLNTQFTLTQKCPAKQSHVQGLYLMKIDLEK